MTGRFRGLTCVAAALGAWGALAGTVAPTVEAGGKPAAVAPDATATVAVTNAPAALPRAKWGAFKVEEARASVTRPADFDAYWDGEVARFEREIPLRPEAKPRSDVTNAVADVVEVSFAMNADGSRRLYGWLAIPKKIKPGRRLPVRVEVPGAGYGGWSVSPHCVADELSLKLTVFDFCPVPYSGTNYMAHFQAFVARVNARAPAPSYPVSGWDRSREDVFFHDVWLTMNRAVDWFAETYADVIDPARFTYTGESQGGGSGFFLLAMNRRFTHGVLRVPAITDVLSFRAGRQSGWPQPYDRQTTDVARAKVLEIAPYFDAVCFAPRVKVPVRVCLGTEDPTCPWPNVAAAYNAIGSADKELLIGFGDNHNSDTCHQRETMDAWRKAWRKEGAK